MYFALLAYFRPTAAQFWRAATIVFAAELLAPLMLVAFRVWRLRRMLRALRRLGLRQRELVLAEIDDDLARAFLATLLLNHGDLNEGGPLTRF